MKNTIMEELKQVLLSEELNNNLAENNYCKELLAKHTKNRVVMENRPDEVGYTCSVKDYLYEDIINNDNCGEYVIELVKSANDSLHLGILSFKDITIKVIADYPSKSDGVDVSISFEVSYQDSLVETITPAIIPGTANDLKEYLILLALLLQDQIDQY